MTDYTEAERAEVRQKAIDTLASVDQTLERLAARGEARRAAGSDLPLRNPPEPKPLPQRPARPAPEPQQDHWAGWREWAAGVNRRLAGIASTEVIAEGVGQGVAEVMNERGAEYRKRFEEIEDRVTKSETATVQLIVELERRLEDLEKRAVLKSVKPRLVDTGGHDAA